MPRLSWLQLGLWYPIGLLLDNLVVPSLREINLHGQWCKSELLSLVYHSSSPLELLNIVHHDEMVRADLDACFESIQTLREISVTASRVKTTYCRGVDQHGSKLQVVVDEEGGTLT